MTYSFFSYYYYVCSDNNNNNNNNNKINDDYLYNHQSNKIIYDRMPSFSFSSFQLDFFFLLIIIEEKIERNYFLLVSKEVEYCGV